MPVLLNKSCCTQWFAREGQCLTQPEAVPPYCAAVALTTQGRAVCNRGCGFSMALEKARDGFAIFQCPFGVSNALLLKDVVPQTRPPWGHPSGAAPRFVLVGGRIFENYAQFRRFMDRAVEAGADPELLLDGCERITYQAALHLRAALDAESAKMPFPARRDVSIAPAQKQSPDFVGASEKTSPASPPPDFVPPAPRVSSPAPRVSPESKPPSGPSLPQDKPPLLFTLPLSGKLSTPFAPKPSAPRASIQDAPASVSTIRLPMLPPAARSSSVPAAPQAPLFLASAEFDLRVSSELKRCERFKHLFTLAFVRVNMNEWLADLPDKREEIRKLVFLGIENILKPSVRLYDMVACVQDAAPEGEHRELFGILLPETDRLEAEIPLRRLLASAQDRFISHLPRQSRPENALYCEMGMAEYPVDGVSLEDLKAVAWQELLTASQTAQGSANLRVVDAFGLPSMDIVSMVDGLEAKQPEDGRGKMEAAR